MSIEFDKAAVASLFLGRHLGSGIRRHVFEYGPAPLAYIVKVEYGEDIDFQNIAEWELWNAAPPTVRKYLSPCVSISPCGRALMMARASVPCPRDAIPKKVPRILDDVHERNWGLIDGKPVLIDYGRNLAIHFAANDKSLRELTEIGKPFR